ncbi:MAG: MBL fold metallo-hydrolase [Proteobacteria bacterium]|nr:MBL fold metallo-hydrolase [Pseudomonadota bacterium]MBU1736656.1 MBL fold metallo-hydrolase [Pseudomonadota bacterium]
MKIISMTVGSMSVCCYLVFCEETREAVIIDPGGDESRVLAECKKQKASVKYIINTHGHPDHVCGNGAIKEATGAEIVIHKSDADFFGQPEVKQYFSILGLKPSPPPDRIVQDGDLISFGNEQLQVILTPGHTPGGICLYNAPNLFTGDTLFVGGVGRTDFPGGDGKTLSRAIRERLLVLPDETRVWPGHGYGGSSSTIGAEKKSNPFLANTFWTEG